MFPIQPLRLVTRAQLTQPRVGRILPHAVVLSMRIPNYGSFRVSSALVYAAREPHGAPDGPCILHLLDNFPCTPRLFLGLRNIVLGAVLSVSTLSFCSDVHLGTASPNLCYKLSTLHIVSSGHHQLVITSRPLVTTIYTCTNYRRNPEKSYPLYPEYSNHNLISRVLEPQSTRTSLIFTTSVEYPHFSCIEFT